MSAMILDGKALATSLTTRVAQEVAALVAGGGRPPVLAVVLVGADPASQIYVGGKVKQTLAVGMRSIEERLPADASQDSLLAIVDRLNADPEVDGILVQLPLPPGIDATAVLDRIDPAKDVDGFHPVNVGRLATGRPSLVPCTPRGCMALIKLAASDIKGRHAVVVGRSTIVGKPMAQLLLAADCTVTVAHSRTRDLADICRRADILVAAIGRPAMLGADHVGDGTIVIDVGINRVAKPEGGTRLVGDVDFAAVVDRAAAITPVPGGVGPMTIACLLENTLTAHRARVAGA
jgi:methylenetetrahydrofolate dehydrogenase (NADP+)/methenyltetrahydrofolate cyclohydrolase